MGLWDGKNAEFSTKRLGEGNKGQSQSRMRFVKGRTLVMRAKSNTAKGELNQLSTK